MCVSMSVRLTYGQFSMCNFLLVCLLCLTISFYTIDCVDRLVNFVSEMTNKRVHRDVKFCFSFIFVVL